MNFAKDYNEEVVYFRDYYSDSNNLKKIIDTWHKQKVQNIIDLGCGMGTHIRYLAKLGLKATGLDLDKDRIAICEEHKGENENYIVGDFLKYKFDKKFDIALNLFYSYQNICLNDEKIRIFWSNVYELLNKDGIFIIEILPEENSLKNYGNNKLNTIKVFTESNGDKKIISSISRFDPVNNLRIITFNTEIFNNGSCISKESCNSVLYAYTYEKIISLVKKHNFQILHLYGDYEGLPEYSIDSKKMIMVLKKYEI